MSLVPKIHSPSAPSPLLPIDDSDWLAALVAATRERDQEAFEGALHRAIQIRPALGLDLVEYLLSEPRDRVHEHVARLALSATGALAQLEIGPFAQAFGPSRDQQFFIWLEQVSRGGDGASALGRLLASAGMLTERELPVVAGLIETRETPREFLLPPARRILNSLSPGHEGLLDELITSPDDDLRVLGLATLARIAPERAPEIEGYLQEMPAEAAQTVVTALCRSVPVDEIPDLILRLDAHPVPLDWTDPLHAYARRTGLQFFESILYLKGNSDEAEHYRRKGVVAANMAAMDHQGGSGRKAVALFRFVFENDTSERVRTNALLAMGSHWPKDDPSGFEQLMTVYETDPRFASEVESARGNFYGNTPVDPEVERRVRDRLAQYRR
ncbi:MAG: hypothetical protein RL885_14230 [Planctomycetota bacterium]